MKKLTIARQKPSRSLRMTPPRYRLAALLARVRPGHIPKPVDFGAPVGREAL